MKFKGFVGKSQKRTIALLALIFVVVVSVFNWPKTYGPDNNNAQAKPLAQKAEQTQHISRQMAVESVKSTLPILSIGKLQIPVELALTSAQIQKGLSGRLSLPADQGLLFVFSKPDIYRFWMPDMHFNIDIVWIGADSTVVDVEENMSADFDPKNPVFYRPSVPAQYVLEVNTGFVKKHRIKAGDKVVLPQLK